MGEESLGRKLNPETGRQKSPDTWSVCPVVSEDGGATPPAARFNFSGIFRRRPHPHGAGGPLRRSQGRNRLPSIHGPVRASHRSRRHVFARL